MNFAEVPEEMPEEMPRETTEETGGQELSLEAVKPSFMLYQGKVQRLLDDAKALEVTCDDRLQYAVGLGGEAKKIAKAIEAKRKEVVEEPSAFVKGVTSICKIITSPLEEVESITKQKIAQYRRKKEIERLDGERTAAEEARKLQAELNLQAEEANRKARAEAMAKAEAANAEEAAQITDIVAPVVTAPMIANQDKVIRSESGASSYEVRRWICTIGDADKIPRLYCTPDQKKLNDAVRMGVREIAGCRIEEVTETRFRM